MATVGWLVFLVVIPVSIAVPVGVLLWWDSRARPKTDSDHGDESGSESRARKLGASAKTTNQRIQAVRVAKADRDASYLIDALTDPDVRSYAARYLADIQAEEAVPAIARLLSASDARVRSAAVNALGKLQGKEFAATLMELAAKDESSVVRSHATGALGRIGADARIERVLIDALSDPDPAVGWCAAHELGSIGDTNAIEPLLTAGKRARSFRRGAYRKAVKRIRARSSRPGDR